MLDCCLARVPIENESFPSVLTVQRKTLVYTHDSTSKANSSYIPSRTLFNKFAPFSTVSEPSETTKKWPKNIN